MSATDPRLYHFRAHGGEEVDVVMEDPAGRLAGVEVKASTSIVDSNFKGLRAFADATGKRFARGIVLYTGQEVVSFGKKFVAAPVASLWS